MEKAPLYRRIEYYLNACNGWLVTGAGELSLLLNTHKESVKKALRDKRCRVKRVFTTGRDTIFVAPYRMLGGSADLVGVLLERGYDTPEKMASVTGRTVDEAYYWIDEALSLGIVIRDSDNLVVVNQPFNSGNGRERFFKENIQNKTF